MFNSTAVFAIVNDSNSHGILLGCSSWTPSKTSNSHRSLDVWTTCGIVFFKQKTITSDGFQWWTIMSHWVIARLWFVLGPTALRTTSTTNIQSCKFSWSHHFSCPFLGSFNNFNLKGESVLHRTVDGSQMMGSPQLRLVVYPFYPWKSHNGCMRCFFTSPMFIAGLLFSINRSGWIGGNRIRGNILW